MTTTTETAVRYERDADGIVTLTLDDPTASANTMNELYQASMAAAVHRLYDEVDDVTGVVVTSAKKTFFAGGNLKLMVQAGPDDAPAVFDARPRRSRRRCAGSRRFPRPVVAAINGAALGGGFEISLACNHRIVVDDPRAEIGLPEAILGPAARRRRRHPRRPAARPPVRADGRAAARAPASSRPRPAPRAWSTSWSPSQDELLPAAKAWILAHPATRTPRRTRGTGPATRCPAAPPRARRWRSSCRPSRRCCASSSRAPTTPPRRRSSPRPSRARSSTSTPRRGSSRAT